MHPLGVGLILSRVTENEDTICAGILHDTIEDCEPYGSVIKDLIEKEFGEDAARMVNDVTEQDKSLPWAVRKQQALDHVQHMQNDSLLVKSADVLNNLSEQIEDWKREGDDMWERFNASKQNQVERYQKLITTIEFQWIENILIGEMKTKLDFIIQNWN